MESKIKEGGRDNFSGATLHELAGRSGYMCAFPNCRRLTVGPSENRKSGLSMVGVGAHITAASDIGPRYNKDLSPEERSDVANGIWMCQTHAKLIDDNASVHTVSELRRWKDQHEDWVFRRVANGPSHVRAGLATLRIEGIGPFRERTELKLGRVTIILGDNGHGKTTLCEALTAFSGGPLYGHFAERWRFGWGAGSAYIEAAIAEGDVLTTVRLTEVAVSYETASAPEEDDDTEDHVLSSIAAEPREILVEVNGAVGAAWPMSRFPSIFLHDKIFGRQEPSFSKAISNIAHQFGLPEDVVWDALKDQFFVSAGYVCRFRRTGRRTIEIAIPESDFYLPPENLSHSEQCRLVIALVTKLCISDRRDTPWMVVVDTTFSERLDAANKAAVLKSLAAMEENGLQSVVCLTFEDGVAIAQSLLSEKWLGASAVGQLTVHTFL